ncbi:MAG TPA: hypothetical protein VGB39_05765, partial [Sphingomicrobium sp.]
MPTWNELLPWLYDFIGRNRHTGGTAGLAAFTTYLNGPSNRIIRAYVPGSPGQGHQASTANILRRLFMPPPDGLDYRGRVNVYLDVNGYPETFGQLDRRFRALLPELRNAVPPYGFWGGTLNTIDLKQPPKDMVNIGITGGCDINDFDYAHETNVKYFLRLQPYRWGLHNGAAVIYMPQQLRFLDATTGHDRILDLM